MSTVIFVLLVFGNTYFFLQNIMCTGSSDWLSWLMHGHSGQVPTISKAVYWILLDSWKLILLLYSWPYKKINKLTYLSTVYFKHVSTSVRITVKAGSTPTCSTVESDPWTHSRAASSDSNNIHYLLLPIHN